MKLSSSNDVLAESKVMILYISNMVGKPILENNLWKIIVKCSDLNYFYFQQFLLDLLENGYIMNYYKDDHSFYDITAFGKETLALTQDIIPGIIKLRVDSNFKEEMESFENAHSVVAEYTPRSETYFDITCKIVERNETIFEVKTFAGSLEQAKKIVDNWNNHADEMYPAMLNILANSKK